MKTPRRDTRTCHVRVVLMCKGKGGDRNSFQANRDASQWWGRRDALVRCVSSFLFGPSCSWRKLQDQLPHHDADKAEASETKPSGRQLVLLFDDDLAEMHMTYEPESDSSMPTQHKRQQRGKSHGFGPLSKAPIVPSERTVIDMWRSAASKPNKEQTFANGIKCTCRIDPTLRPVETDGTINSANNHSRNKGSNKAGNARSSGNSQSIGRSPPAGLDSKRSLLEFLQAKCSIEFLRDKGLNSSASVILRKVNKKTLTNVWYDWYELQKAEIDSNKASDAPSSVTSPSPSPSTTPATTAAETSSDSQPQALAEIIFSKLLDLPKEFEGRHVVSTLHEKFDEFPCFHIDPSNGGNESCAADHIQNLQPTTITIFLGAVRDMHDYEYDALQAVCQRRNLNLVGMRFGQVPEFTSKILSILAFHHSNRVFASAVDRMVRKKGGAVHNNSVAAQTELVPSNDQPSTSKRSTAFHIICRVPTTTEIFINSAEISKRTRVHWAMVRTTVCGLWRSRIAGGGSSSASNIRHACSLRFVFDDGLVLHLEAEEFVSKLATNHQAAPCEYQILDAIASLVKERRRLIEPSQGKALDAKSMKGCFKDLVKETIRNSTPVIRMIAALDAESASSQATTAATAITEQFYNHPSTNRDDGINAILMAMEIRCGKQQHNNSNQRRTEHRKSFRKVLRKVAEKHKIPIMNGCILQDMDCVDYEGCSIVNLQHGLHQGRLFCVEDECNAVASKRRKQQKLDGPESGTAITMHRKRRKIK